MKFKSAPIIGALLLALPFASASSQSRADEVIFLAPGDLASGSGKGRKDATVYYPDIRFPIESGPAYANSQVYNPGGSGSSEPDQCSEKNYSYPWRDNYCESRGWKMQLCPSGTGHQGQDIRPATCNANTYWAVAVSDGVIVSIGSFSVTLQSPEGTLFRYLHLQMNDLAIQLGDHVEKGDRIGKVSNWFGDSKTTVHLHFDIKDSVTIGGKVHQVYMPPYASLVASYRKLMGI